MGEEPWRVTISGALSLDNLHTVRLLTCKELSARFGLHVNEIPFLLVTFHPVTLEYEQTERQMAELLTALAAYDLPLVFTMPNADTSGRIITRMIEEFVATHSSAQAVDNLGTQGYFSMMALAAAMVGNSSSGILEAASFELPVVNIGNRQRGRVRGDNVIDVGYKHDSILEGLHRALDSQFRTKLRGIRNPYDFGGASNKIVEVLKRVQLDDRLVVKHFHDLEAVSSVGLRTV
jgi:UDP-N-acetylglucosamine 2-epimerase (non-hydrolysing)/GDP/UDP-N,N'-diacetylbacillosamine 2-epimerase (hydrolysing)